MAGGGGAPARRTTVPGRRSAPGLGVDSGALRGGGPLSPHYARPGRAGLARRCFRSPCLSQRAVGPLSIEFPVPL